MNPATGRHGNTEANMKSHPETFLLNNAKNLISIPTKKETFQALDSLQSHAWPEVTPFSPAYDPDPTL